MCSQVARILGINLQLLIYCIRVEPYYYTKLSCSFPMSCDYDKETACKRDKLTLRTILLKGTLCIKVSCGYFHAQCFSGYFMHLGGVLVSFREIPGILWVTRSGVHVFMLRTPQQAYGVWQVGSLATTLVSINWLLCHNCPYWVMSAMSQLSVLFTTAGSYVTAFCQLVPVLQLSV